MNIPKKIQDLMNSESSKNNLKPEHQEVVNKVYNWFKEKFPENEQKDNSGRNKIIRLAYIYKAENNENTCENCKKLDGKIFENEENANGLLPVHPNCKCKIFPVLLDDNNKIVTDERFEEFINITLSEEGGFKTATKTDRETNRGITDITLNNFNKTHKNFNFSKDVNKLTNEETKTIYYLDYYKDRKIKNIDNTLLSFILMDTGIMGNFSKIIKILQKTLNDTQNLNLDIDGLFGDNTVEALNLISNENIDSFIDIFLENRDKYLETTANFKDSKNGWKNRTKKYKTLKFKTY